LVAAQALLKKRGWGSVLSVQERARAARLLSSRGFADELVERLLGDPTLDPPARDD
jgi:regulatory protein